VLTLEEEISLETGGITPHGSCQSTGKTWGGNGENFLELRGGRSVRDIKTKLLGNGEKKGGGYEIRYWKRI